MITVARSCSYKVKIDKNTVRIKLLAGAVRPVSVAKTCPYLILTCGYLLAGRLMT
jgi:hypothetical protein